MTSRWSTTPAGLPRARGLGLPLDGKPGVNNAITDVPGVRIGYTSLIEGSDIRTGVTAVLPRPPDMLAVPVFAGFHSLNGNGELTGSHWLAETGQLTAPMTITNTHSVGVCRDATVRWMQEHSAPAAWSLPVSAETYDGVLNDINGFHVTSEHVFQAIDSASEGAIEEGSVGGGVGMMCYGYKGGSGTASRLVEIDGTQYILGAFVQANFGRPRQLTVGGIPVGALWAVEDAISDEQSEHGSIIGVIATNAPLMPHQLSRLSRRAGLGMARGGAVSGNGSGDLFLAFSTANADAFIQTATPETALRKLDFLAEHSLDKLFAATVAAIEEAILNALIANADMTGYQGNTIRALPRERLVSTLASHGRLVDPH